MSNQREGSAKRTQAPPAILYFTSDEDSEGESRQPASKRPREDASPEHSSSGSGNGLQESAPIPEASRGRSANLGSRGGSSSRGRKLKKT